MKNYAMLDRANRRLRELDQLKSEFLANVGHELRTPLNSIIGFAELLLQGYSGPLNENQSRQLAMILNSGNHLLRVVNDVIEVSMLNAGQVVLKNEHVSITSMIHDVLQVLQSKAEKKNLNIMVDAEKDLPNCYCSYEKLKLLLYNLVDNAIKFSSSGDITISALRASSLSDNDSRKEHFPDHDIAGNNSLLVSVQDQGIGIRQENFDILFDEFRQVDGSLTREYNGIGLGLAISKKLVELYGGKIWLESQIGVGTTFYFTVPLSNEK
jgi:signal transduction histidine kinase